MTNEESKIESPNDDIRSAHSSHIIRVSSFIAIAILLLTFALTCRFASLHKSGTYDEPLHLISAWIQTDYHDFRVNPEDPALWKYWIAVGADPARFKLRDDLPAWKTFYDNFLPDLDFTTQELYRTPGVDPGALLESGRGRMVFIGLFLGIAIAAWAWRLGGPVAGAVAAGFYAFDPNFLGHAALIKNDVPISFLFLCLAICYWKLAQRAGVWQILAVAMVTACAVTTKYSGLIALPLGGLFLIPRILSSRPWPILRWTARKFSQRLVFSGAVLVFILIFCFGFVWTVYDFRFTAGESPDTVGTLNKEMRLCAAGIAMREHHVNFNTQPQEVMEWLREWKPNSTLKTVLWLNENRLLPQTYLRGFLYTYGTTQFRTSFLMGKRSLSGWWYYFPLAMLFKTPLATLTAIALALIVAVMATPMLFRSSSHRAMFWALIFFPVPYLAISMFSGINLGLRHVLPLYPFLFLFIGLAVARAIARWPRAASIAAAVLLIGLAGETFSVYPDYISFFNLAAGGARGGAKLLGDSNLDWGQDLPALAEWQRTHPDRQLNLAYFGSADPRYYGIHYRNLPGSNAPADQTAPDNKPQVFAISVTVLQGLYMTDQQHETYKEFNNRQPIAILGGSIWLFD